VFPLKNVLPHVFESLNSPILSYADPECNAKLRKRAVQWHYIDKLSNDTVPNHILITTNHQAYLFTIELKLRDDFRSGLENRVLKNLSFLNFFKKTLKTLKVYI